ncbi:MAG: amidohydrolase, partial [Acidimicrobiales bacterium]
FYANAAQVELLDRTLELLPELKVVMNHLGFCPNMSDEITIDDDLRPRFSVTIPPDSLEAVTRVAQRKHVYVHFSGMYAFSQEPYPYPGMAAMVEPIFAAFGPERLLMASDYPWIYRNPGYPETLALLDEHLPDLSDEERDLIRGGNAARLFSFS